MPSTAASDSRSAGFARANRPEDRVGRDHLHLHLADLGRGAAPGAEPLVTLLDLRRGRTRARRGAISVRWERPDRGRSGGSASMPFRTASGAGRPPSSESSARCRERAASSSSFRGVARAASARKRSDSTLKAGRFRSRARWSRSRYSSRSTARPRPSSARARLHLLPALGIELSRARLLGDQTRDSASASSTSPRDESCSSRRWEAPTSATGCTQLSLGQRPLPISSTALVAWAGRGGGGGVRASDRQGAARARVRSRGLAEDEGGARAGRARARRAARAVPAARPARPRPEPAGFQGAVRPFPRGGGAATPRNEEELLRVPGTSPMTLKKVGAQLLEAVRKGIDAEPPERPRSGAPNGQRWRRGAPGAPSPRSRSVTSGSAPGAAPRRGPQRWRWQVIAPNAVLWAIARANPADLESLAAVEGMDPFRIRAVRPGQSSKCCRGDPGQQKLI